MSFTFAAPDALFAAAANWPASTPLFREPPRLRPPRLPTCSPAAGAGALSAAIASFFGDHALQYQALSAQAASFQDQFTSALASAGQLLGSELTNAFSLKALQQAVANIENPRRALLGHPLIGEPATATGPAPRRPVRQHPVLRRGPARDAAGHGRRSITCDRAESGGGHRTGQRITRSVVASPDGRLRVHLQRCLALRA